MTINIGIKSIDIYRPENAVTNDFYIEHYQQKGKDISGFLDFMGRDVRHIIDNDDENGLTMGIEASRKAIAKAGLTIEDIDMIFFATQAPEYSIPTSGIMLHDALGGKSSTRVMDLNANCSGMVVAVDQATMYMKTNPNIKYSLIVGSDHLSALSNPDEVIAYATFGDAACALILESREEPGFLDAEYHTHTEKISHILYPIEGLSKVLSGKEAGKHLQFIPFDVSFASPIIDDMIERLMERNRVGIADIQALCFSQLAYSDSIRIQEKFGFTVDKIMYSADKYGYTGTNSPFIAFHDGIEQGKIQRGDTVLFWTVGAGHQFVAMLFTY